MSKVAKKTTDLQAGTVTFEFGNGSKLVCNITKLSKETLGQLTLHGAAQKVGDSYAGAANPDEALKFATETWADLEKGQWTTRAASSGPKISILAQAVARIRKITIEKATETLTKLNETEPGKETVKSIRNHPQVVAAMAAIRAENAQKKLKESSGDAGDLGALLAPA